MTTIPLNFHHRYPWDVRSERDHKGPKKCLHSTSPLWLGVFFKIKLDGQLQKPIQEAKETNDFKIMVTDSKVSVQVTKLIFKKSFNVRQEWWLFTSIPLTAFDYLVLKCQRGFCWKTLLSFPLFKWRGAECAIPKLISLSKGLFWANYFLWNWDTEVVLKTN